MRTSIPCSNCDGPLRIVGYRQIVNEDPNQNFKPISNTYYCPKDRKFFKIKTEEIKVE